MTTSGTREADAVGSIDRFLESPGVELILDGTPFKHLVGDLFARRTSLTLSSSCEEPSELSAMCVGAREVDRPFVERALRFP